MHSLEIDKTLIPWVGKTAKMQRLFIGDKLKGYGPELTFEQLLLLFMLHQKDGQNQNDLAFVTERNKASLARLVDILEKKNLVARLPSVKDKRVNRIFLTKQGQIVFKETIPVVNEAFEKMQEGISPEEKELAIKILQKIQNNIKNLIK